MKKWRLFNLSFLCCFVAMTAAASAVIGLCGLVGYQPIGGISFGMKGIQPRPVETILAISFSYAVCAALWITWCGRVTSRWRWPGILLALYAALPIAATLGGVVLAYLWDNSGGIDNLIWGGKSGLRYGPLLIQSSLPLVAVYFMTGAVITHGVALRLFEKKCGPSRV